jgi:hypothetical protein
MAGFYELATSLPAPILGTRSSKLPIVSGGPFKKSRFRETAAGDRVRSSLLGRACSATRQILGPVTAGEFGTPSPHCHAGSAVF